MTAREHTSFGRALYPDAAVVEAHGELDVVAAPAFRSALADAVATGRRLVVVDMAHVQFIDSAGLSVVFAAQRALPVSQRLVLAGVPDRMRRMLRLAAVESVVEVHGPGEPQPWREGEPGTDPAAGS
jgi:anti-anti-sigma factor